MDIAAILRELDAEIEKLQHVRKIIAGLEYTVRCRKKPSRKPLSSPVAAAEPLVTKLPPKSNLEHRQRAKSVAHGLEHPVRSRKKKPSRKPLSSPVAAAEPLVTKLPPKSNLEHRQRAKSVAHGLEHPVRSRKKKPNHRPLPSPAAAAPKPLLIRLPSKLKREYRPRVRSLAQAPIALASAPSDRPVFVPRGSLPAPTVQSPKSTDNNPELLEATFRKNLLRAV